MLYWTLTDTTKNHKSKKGIHNAGSINLLSDNEHHKNIGGQNISNLLPHINVAKTGKRITSNINDIQDITMDNLKNIITSKQQIKISKKIINIKIRRKIII